MHRRSIRSIVLAAFVATAAGGCIAQTFQYRAIQADFIDAVRTDNAAAVDPLTRSASGAGYPEIVAKLTPERIADLDPRLHANAWVIRAYSQWGAAGAQGADTKQLTTDAVRSSETGLAELKANHQDNGSRDHVLLTLLPALAIERDVAADWEQGGRSLTSDRYDADYAPRFATVVDRLDAASQAKTERTPSDTTYYVAYHRWRIVQNWHAVIDSIQGPADSRNAARKSALTKLGAPAGVSVKQYSDTLRNDIPDGHPLRALIAAQGG